MNAHGQSQTAVAQTRSQAGGRKRRTLQGNDNFNGYLFLSPWLIGLVVFTVLPIVASLFLSFTEYNILSAPKWIGTRNFVRLFTRDPRYWRAVKVTFSYVFTAVPLRLLFALIVAMLLNTPRRLVPLYRALYYAPSMVGGSIAMAVVWRRVFGEEGLVNYLLAMLFGITGPIWLGNVKTALWTIIFLAAWQFGSPMLIFLAGLKQTPAELYESASIDGAGKWSQFFHITLPMLTPVILFNMIMQIISGFLVFDQAFIVSGGNGAPRDSLLVYSLYLYQRAFLNLQMGYSAAMAWALLVVIAIFTAVVFKSSQYWVFYESKGGE